uniref:Uncharacterized protein n=1 Tax=Anguilla anguilla TaxID=7936 RepID=A0A0E9RB32_ANGAN
MVMSTLYRHINRMVEHVFVKSWHNGFLTFFIFFIFNIIFFKVSSI